MAVGPSTYLANKILDAIGNNTSLAIATAYLKLHVGDPGGAGTSNAAAETSRKAVSFGTGASGLMSNDAVILWTALGSVEDFTHWSLWDASSGGNFLWSGTLTGDAVAIGGGYRIPVGNLDLTLTGLAA